MNEELPPILPQKLSPHAWSARVCCMLLAIACSGADEPLRVGVFDQQATGGQGASVAGLIQGLRQAGYQAESFRDMHPLTLHQYDIVYLCDMHQPGNVHKDWRKSIDGFLQAGGSLLQTWHHHILADVSVGVRRVYGSRRMHIKGEHPAVADVDDFDASCKDHIVERVGPNGTVLIENDAGDPVAAAGYIGRGKVVSTGLALAIPNGGASRPPKGAELRLLRSFLSWLTPTVPRRERLTELLRTPQIIVTPPDRLTAAGFSAAFRVRVVSPDGKPAELHSDAADAIVNSLQPSDADPRFQDFRIAIPTPPRKHTERQINIRAAFDATVLHETVTVTGIFVPPPQDEQRGVWLHVGQDRHPQTVMPELKRLGIDLAILRIAGGTAAFYASKVQPDVQDPLAAAGGDWLADAVKYAHQNGIEIHPYVNNCIVEGRTSKESLSRLQAAGRLQQDPGGRTINWFCPSQPGNIEAIEKPMVEIATRYDVDGIQYDFIRYPNASGCFCTTCRALFAEETGSKVSNWPDDVLPEGARYSDWVEFRCRRISAIVCRVSTAIRKAAPKVRISAAVFRDWPKCRETNGQDWVRWCQEGWLDFVCPMNYTLAPQRFADSAQVHRGEVPANVPILQGIGINSGSGRMKTAAELAVQIVLARQAGAAGFVGFCYVPEHTASLFEPLQQWLQRQADE